MRKKILWILPMLGLAVAATSHAKSVVINPQAGVIGSNMTSDTSEIDDEARLGYQVGGQVRLGGRGYVAPGVFWQHSSLEATEIDDATLEQVTDDLEVNSLVVPVHFGYHLSSGDPATNDALGVRVFGGPTMTMITKVGDNAFGIEKDDYEGTTLGAQLGAGLDVSSLTIDAHYEFGLTNTFKADEDTKQNTARATLGLKF